MKECHDLSIIETIHGTINQNKMTCVIAYLRQSIHYDLFASHIQYIVYTVIRERIMRGPYSNANPFIFANTVHHI